MKINIWATIQNIGGELNIETFQNEAEATAHAWALVEETWLERAPEESFEEFKAENDGDLNNCWVMATDEGEDTLHVEEIEVEVPGPAPAQFEYEMRFWLDNGEEFNPTIDSFETSEMRDKHVEGLEATGNGLVFKTGCGIYRRPVSGGVGGIRELEHIADFEHEDEARLVLDLLDTSAAQKAGAPRRIGVTIEGGNVQSVFSDDPEGLPTIYTIDYDVEGADAERLIQIPDPDVMGNCDLAFVQSHNADKWGNAEFWAFLDRAIAVRDGKAV